MRARNLHLVFHPFPGRDFLYRLECLGGGTAAGPPITVGPSARLEEAVRQYDACFAADRWNDTAPEEDVLNVLTAWVGRLLWDNLLSWGRDILSTPLFAHLAAEALAAEQTQRAWSPAQILVYVSDRWAERESRKAGLGKEALLEVARHAAHALGTSFQATVNVKSLIKQINRSLEARHQPPLGEKALEVLAMHSLLVVHHEQARFAHRLFQTFFAACYLVDRLEESWTTPTFDDLLEYPHGPPSDLVGPVAELLAWRSEADAEPAESETPAGGLPRRSWSDNLKWRLAELSGRAAKAEDDEQLRQLSVLCESFVLRVCSALDATRVDALAPPSAAHVWRGLRFQGRTLDALTIRDIVLGDTTLDTVVFHNCLFANSRLAGGRARRCLFSDNRYEPLETLVTLQPDESPPEMDEESARSLSADLARAGERSTGGEP